MPGQRAREGRILIDHSASPGTPQVPEGTVGEFPVRMCCHCGGFTLLNPDRKRPRGHCQKCDGYVCDNPGCHATEHVPFKKIIDDSYERQNGKIIP